MTCRGASAIKSTALNAYCGGVKTFCAKFNSDLTAADLAGDYIQFYSAGNATQYYVWFDDGIAADPAPGGTAIPVVISSTDNIETIIAAAAAAVNAEADFCALVAPRDKAALVIKVVDYDSTLDPTNGTGTDSEIFVEQEGEFIDLGLIDGDTISIATSPNVTDITCLQTGAIPVGKIDNGTTVDVSITFKGDKDTLFQKLLPGECTEGGITVRGYGSGQVGRNLASDARRLILHPVGLPLSDRSQDIVFLLASTSVSDFSYSSVNPDTITVDFTGLPDEFWKCEDTNVYFIGDHLIA